MQDKQAQIDTKQFFIFAFCLTIGTSILVTPAGIAHIAREDAWIASLISLIINAGMVILYIALCRLYPGQTLFEILESVFGKWLGKGITLLYLFYFLVLSGTLLGNLGFFLTSEMMPETPIEAIEMLFLFAAVMSARLGVVVLARVSELLFPWVFFLYLILILSLTPQIQWEHIQPVLEEGMMPALKAGGHNSMFQELVVLMMFYPLINTNKGSWKPYLTGSLAGNLALFLIVLLSILVLGIEQTENSTFPAFELAKDINVGNFFQRVEGILITIWILTFFIKISLLFHSTLSGLRTVFGMKDPSHLILPLAVIFIIIAWNTYINTVYVGEIIQKVWGKASSFYLIIVPVLLLGLGFVRQKWKTAHQSS
ncbi:GerAB/ArcD/ProY family transporter [Paenibacillus sp. JDR-2]|uniref:GerAB/ArcD/ProY family transporter n=1 Tax=Paenibacillus sp. (strain JDR-2) TaxID=324057 RepID=UPI0001665B1E|nr:endospore germination permease [Paenibacillus sp. JDR-2]ACT01723.1 spore germination protein [Paenibacillus sp. JDR-2]